MNIYYVYKKFIMSILLYACITAPAMAEYGTLPTLHVRTFEQDEVKVRTLLIDAFLDIVGAPTVTDQVGHLQIKLLPNHYLSQNLYFLDIQLEHEGSFIHIHATPYSTIQTVLTKRDQDAISLGVRLIVEGVAKDLNYPYEIASGKTMEGLDPFISVRKRFKRRRY